MERKTTQEQFNELVHETMADFDLDSMDEAIEFAASQFTSQNLSLWNIIQDASVVRGEDALTKFSAKYSSQLEKYDPSVDETEFLRQLEQITQLLENSDPKALLAFQDYAASKRVDRIVLEIARRKESTSSILEPSLGFIALCYKGYPDLVSEETIDWLVHLCQPGNGIACTDGCYLHPRVIDILVDCCFKHERNRQSIFAKGAASLIAGRLTTNNEDELIPALKLISALCRDDDVRVEASSAHVHATELAEHLLKPCLSILKDRPGSTSQQTHLLAALASMTVANDLATSIFNEFDFIRFKELLEEHTNKPALLARLFKWLAALGGNDDIRSEMKLLIPSIIQCMYQNEVNGTGTIEPLDSPPHHSCSIKATSVQVKNSFFRHAFLLISILTLRNKENSSMFIENGIIDRILSVITNPLFEKTRNVGCLALRNMASSTKLPKPFEEAGVIDVMNEMLGDKTDCRTVDDCKSVLVALNAPVELQSRWTGERGDIVGANR
ncbi:armadillo repeat containing 6 [Nesidiocoris tenuis]|uniref:Armadillo repeat containing 6 n=2 Tax=Nesidiocoris tenuis TaxID=355587 RepID=A0ABN7AD57_9HEMI|nr:armadillo repeat containing 6 [Nesidiocoris tenuis]